jgi:hypothetical protein
MAKKQVAAQESTVVETQTLQVTDAVEVEGSNETTSTGETEEVKDSTDDFNLAHEADVMKAGELWLIAHFGNKSKAIRGLAALGHKCGPISRALNIRFQHARNVLNKPLKRLIKEEREAAKNGVDTDLGTDE